MLIPVVLLVPVECGDSSHFAIGQREVENRDVLPDMVGIARTGDSDHTPLQVPSENHLHYRFVVFGCNFRQYRVTQKFLLMSATSERIPCFDKNAEVMEMFHYFRVLIIGMNLVLNQHRFDVHFRQKFIDFLDIVDIL